MDTHADALSELIEKPHLQYAFPMGFSAGVAVVGPAGRIHHIAKTGSVPMKFHTLYAPPNHRDGVVHHTRVDAGKDGERFDGKATE